MLLTFALIYNLAVTAFDVKDAFLMVPQMEVLYVKIPMRIRRWTGNPHTHWLLKRCLPGHRNAALRWHQHLGGLCEQAELEAFPGAPTSFRHKDLSRKVFVNIHVDDILLFCNPGDVEWFDDEGRWTTCAWKLKSVDVLQEEDDNEAWWNFASTQLHRL
eukprot:s3633_g5.t1